MDYLTDNALFNFNGTDKRMGVAIDHGHIIAFSRKGGFWDDLLIGAAGLVGATFPIVSFPVALAALLAEKKLSRPQQESLSATIDKLKRKFKLSDEDILISNTASSTVTLSGNSFLTFGNTKVHVSGRFAIGDRTVDVKFYCAFTTGKSALQRIFERNDYRVSLA